VSFKKHVKSGCGGQSFSRVVGGSDAAKDWPQCKRCFGFFSSDEEVRGHEKFCPVRDDDDDDADADHGVDEDKSELLLNALKIELVTPYDHDADEDDGDEDEPAKKRPRAQTTFECPECCLRFESERQLSCHLEEAHCEDDSENAGSYSFESESLIPEVKLEIEEASDDEYKMLRPSSSKSRPKVIELGSRSEADGELYFKDESRDKYKCIHCYLTFYSEPLVRKHCDEAHKSIDLNCYDCNKAFANGIKLKQHMATVHNSQKNYECSTCSQKFRARDRFNEAPFRPKYFGQIFYRSIADKSCWRLGGL
jgi:hypothetical protein